LQIAQLVDNLLDDRFELAHLDFEDREGFLVCDGTARCQRFAALSYGEGDCCGPQELSHREEEWKTYL
jgi:hypothetical protein